MDLPKNTQELINTLIRTNGLNGWNIFSEKSGGVTVKLRFGTGSHAAPTSQACPEPVCYVKKAGGRSRRDYNRSVDFKSDMKTRSMTKGTKGKEAEEARDSESDHFTINISPEPVAVEKLDMPESPSTAHYSPAIQPSPDLAVSQPNTPLPESPAQQLFSEAEHVNTPTDHLSESQLNTIRDLVKSCQQATTSLAKSFTLEQPLDNSFESLPQEVIKCNICDSNLTVKEHTFLDGFQYDILKCTSCRNETLKRTSTVT